MRNLEQRKQELLHEMQKAVNLFLFEHPGLRYYCFALDCNAEYAEINLCLNTEEDFLQILKRFQDGPYRENYQTEEEIFSLRYDPGNWNYQCFATFYTVEETELKQMYGEEEERRLSEMMRFNFDLLNRFCETETFQRIPKTDGFRVLCIDHDEDLEEALNKTDRFVHWRAPN